MYKHISIGLILSFFVGCSSTTSNKNLKVNNTPSKISKPIEKLVVNEKTTINKSNEESKIESKNKVYFKFEGIWEGSKTTRFLQRKLYLKDTEQNSTGYLELSYLTTSGKLVVAEKFDVLIDFINEKTIITINDSKTNKTEKAYIIKDSENMFRIKSLVANSIFFEKDTMSFKKVIKEIPLHKRKRQEFRSLGLDVKNYKNNLIWQDSKSAKYLKSSFLVAKNYCNTLKRSDTNDWRLPTKDELITTFDKNKQQIVNSFEYLENGCYWSETESLDDKNSAWCFNYETGSLNIKEKKEKLHIRCVREEIK